MVKQTWGKKKSPLLAGECGTHVPIDGVGFMPLESNRLQQLTEGYLEKALDIV